MTAESDNDCGRPILDRDLYSILSTYTGSSRNRVLLDQIFAREELTRKGFGNDDLGRMAGP